MNSKSGDRLKDSAFELNAGAQIRHGGCLPSTVMSVVDPCFNVNQLIERKSNFDMQPILIV